MIEIVGPRTRVAFDGRVIEVFGPDRSRRVHLEQILSAEVHRGELMLDECLVLELRLIEGHHISVRFAAGRERELGRLMAALAPRP